MTARTRRPAGADPQGRIATPFLDALAADFARHGAAAIARLREEDPVNYLRICAALVPKQASLPAGEDLVTLLAALERRQRLEEKGAGRE
jgi:hypothetical protein